MSEFINAVRQASDGSLTGVSDAVILALIVVGGLLVIASVSYTHLRAHET